MSKPLLRVVPPPAGAAQPAQVHTAIFGADLERLGLATTATGLGIRREGGRASVVATRDQLGALADELERRGSTLAAPLHRYLEPVTAWTLRTRTLPLDRPIVLGIVNLTDDSFSGDGVGHDTGAALAAAERLRGDGADVVDVGAETARASRPVLEADTEARLMGQAVGALVREGHLVSADTYKPEVAQAALDSGAEIVNDISGLTVGLGAAGAAVRAGAGYVLNYSYSVPKRRPESPPQYADVVAETVAWMAERLSRLEAAGAEREHVAIDPGIAFGKSHDEDIQVLRRLSELTTPGQPLLLAHSRKNFIGSVSGLAPDDRDLETHVTAALAFAQGARIFRVHDVAGARRALAIAEAVVATSAGAFAPDGESWPWRAGAQAADAVSREALAPPPPGQRW